MATIAVSNETKSTSVRTTKDNRTIRYNLQVIQQPERARACGSGAKSSADRRPVDPPPIVELRVFENDQEITFAYNANFFLHASIENARAIAAGRTPSTTPSFPVLTGTPVAGMAYLDRPTPAGYFIFPDLSVRHEGKYRLSFSLFENLSEVKDLDLDDPDVICDGNNFVSHRAEVKSAPFTVFSAKKFPGLSESTALSRMVAEQGCRVRIRRDVRMRRRETKSSKEWNEFDDETGGYEEDQRAVSSPVYNQQAAAPLEADRPRSVSNASNASLVPPRRRPSTDELAQSYHANNGYQHMPPPQNPSYSQMQPYASHQNQYQNQYAQQHGGMVQPPHAQYSHQSQPLHSSYQNQNAVQINQAYDYQNYQQSHYGQTQQTPRQDSATDYGHVTDYRRSSVTQQQSAQQYSGPSQVVSPYNPMDSYNRPQQMHQSMHAPVHAPSISGSHPLPALKTLQPPPKLENPEPVSPMYQSPANMMSSAPMSANSDAQSNYSMSHTASHLPPMSSTSAKRSFSSTFDTRHMNERLTQGARPNLSMASNHDEPDVEPPMDRAAMNYRRADGTRIQRRVPDIGV